MVDARDVSVVICTRNRAESLAQVFPSLARQAVPDGVTAEAVVVDNGSTDATAEVVRRQEAFGAPVRLVRAPEPGLSRARNAGMAAARGRVILFTDDDVRLPPDWLGRMAAPLLERRADAVAGSVRLAPHLLRPWMEPFHRATLAATDLLKPENPGVMMGASMGFHRHVLERVPRFDVHLGAGALGTAEESLFSWQLLHAGYSIARVASPEVEHHCAAERLTRGAFLDAARKLGRSYAYIGYHWLHRTHLNLDGKSRLQLRRASVRAWLQIRRWRLRHLFRTAAEGVSQEEFYLVMRHAFIQQFRTERQGPRRYPRGWVPPEEPRSREPEDERLVHGPAHA